MTNIFLPVPVENNHLEPFEDRIDILFREIELATKWQRPSVLWAIYNSEYVRSDADIALENRLHNLGQRIHHFRIENVEGEDISVQISKLINQNNAVIFVEGLRWGKGRIENNVYTALNDRLEFFVDHQVRLVFWLTEKEAIDLAHFSPEYWSARHRVIEFVDSPRLDQISPHLLESVWQGTGEFTDPKEDLEAKIALRTALLTDLPTGSESTAARANLLLTLGMLHWRRGDFEKSTLYLNSALDDAVMLEDDYFEAICFNALGLVQTDQGRIEEAIQAYQNAISLAPDRIFPWNNLGHLYRKIGRHTDALAAFQKSIEHDGSDAAGWNGLGDLYHETGQIDEAIHAYLKAIEFSPDFAHPWCGIGDCHLGEGQLDEALNAHRKAIEIDRRMIKSWLGLAKIYRMQGDNRNARIAYRTALELDPRNALGWDALGHLYYEAAEYDEAMRCYHKSIELTDGCFQTYCNLASIHILKGLHGEAIPLLLKALELSEDIAGTAQLWNQLGDAYRQNNEFENAMVAYRKADTLKPESVSSQVELSSCKLDQQLATSIYPACQPESQPELASFKEEPPKSEEFNPSHDEPGKPEGSISIEEEPRKPEASNPKVEESQFSEMSNSHPEDSQLPEVSDPAMADSADNSSVQDEQETPSIKPEAEFLAWLDGLGLVQPAPSQTGMPDPALPGSSEGESGDEAKFSKTGIKLQNSDVSMPNPLVEVELSETSEVPSESTENQNLSDPPEEERPAIPGSNQAVCSTDNMESPDPNQAPIDLEKPKMDETTVRSESLTQESEDNRQAQVTFNEKNAQIWNELGNIYYNTGAFDEAMHAFEMATELDPYFGWSYYNLASIYIHFKRYSEAIPLYEKSLQLLDDQKDKALLWNRLGDAFRRLNKHEQAVSAYRNAIELDPENVSLLTRARFSLLGNLRV